MDVLKFEFKIKGFKKIKIKIVGQIEKRRKTGKAFNLLI